MLNSSAFDVATSYNEQKYDVLNHLKVNRSNINYFPRPLEFKQVIFFVTKLILIPNVNV